MKYYDEKCMEGIRSALETEVLRWRGVSTKPMMGCLCYFSGRKFFAFLVTNGIVVTKLPRADRTRLSQARGGQPFEMAGKTAGTWVRVPLREANDVAMVLPFVKKSYEVARA